VVAGGLWGTSCVSAGILGWAASPIASGCASLAQPCIGHAMTAWAA